MTTLLVRLAGPMQSWGIQSRFGDRDTGRYPSKSGVVGMLCAALGRDRSEPIDDMAGLRMGVRIDRPGVVSRDFHTAGGGTWAGKPYGVVKASGGRGATVISSRHYLSDAEFLVGLEGGDTELLEQCRAALDNPRWLLFLGRKAFPPEWPVDLGLHEARLEEVLHNHPWRRPPQWRDKEKPTLELVIEAGPGGDAVRPDQPVSFAHDRRSFALRRVRTEWTDDYPVVDNLEELLSCTSHG